MEWTEVFRKIKEKQDFSTLEEVLKDKYKKGRVFPPREEIYTAFELTSFENVRVVILGQDPYHGEGQSHGLAYSVNEEIKIPPSLRNMYKEIEDDRKSLRTGGSLKDWDSQGVLFLNTGLTVDGDEANSHRGCWWERFTDSVIETVSEEIDNVVFILWSNPSQRKET